jgi:hypothetical protein
VGNPEPALTQLDLHDTSHRHHLSSSPPSPRVSPISCPAPACAAGWPKSMGQANSRGSPDQRPRRQRLRSTRPLSWASSRPSPQPQPQPRQHDSLPEMVQPPLTSAPPTSQRFSLPFNILQTHHESSDAGSSGADAAQIALNRRRSRVTRARESISSLPSLFHRRTSSTPGNAAEPAPTSVPTASRSTLRHTTSTGYERSQSQFLPRLNVPDLDISFEDLGSPDPSSPQQLRPSSARRDGRASSMMPVFRPDRSLRSMTNSFRRRRGSPPRREEDQAAMLSRLLSVAAAATAASLMGEDHQAVSEARNVAGDGEDGTFDSFLQALQNGRIASALRQSEHGSEDGLDTQGGTAVPLNFFRMFRFGSSTTSRRNENRSGGRLASGGNHDGDEDGDGRMVPIIIVGIRSINPGTGNEREDNIPPFLDALSSFPPNAASQGDETVDGMLRQPQNGTRFSHRRRASMGGMNNHPSGYDSQRHWRSPDRPRPWSTFSDSPPGPLPPPSTPASSGLSAMSSGATTPSLVTPPSPIAHSSGPSRRGSFIRRTTGPNLEPTVEEPAAQQRIPRQRRLSDSDFPTRFGSGSSRRNGVVEPDNNPGEGSRSWIIYVLGGSYPENHPILTTPSLFTDSPTYEDMMLLSSLLGPAKPPVASEEDVASAPGLFKIVSQSGTLVAEPVEADSEVVILSTDARCLVCLADFEIDEEARKLVNCGHLFHRECIDQVSHSYDVKYFTV